MSGFHGSPFADWLERNDVDCFFREHSCGQVANTRPEFFDDADAVRFHSTE